MYCLALNIDVSYLNGGGEGQTDRHKEELKKKKLRFTDK
jgi:hypothetical protein